MSLRLTLFIATIGLVPALHAQAVDGIHAPVNRTVTLPVEEGNFQISVSAALETTPQQVKRLLQEAGAPDCTVVLIGLGQDYAPRILYADSGSTAAVAGAPIAIFSATCTVSAAASAGLAKALLDLQGKLAAPFTSVNFGVTYGASATTVEAMRLSMLPKLVDEARKSAQNLAAAAGIKLGAIRAISESGGVYAYIGGVGGMSAYRIGDFSGLITSPPASAQYPFYLELVFASLP